MENEESETIAERIMAELVNLMEASVRMQKEAEAALEETTLDESQ